VRAGSGVQLLQGKPKHIAQYRAEVCDGGADIVRKVYAILDEVFLAGEIQETSKQVVLTRLEHLDKLE
jgi:hypothetical protein